MVAAGIIKAYQKNIWIIFFTIVISIFLSSFGYAKTYRWEDFTEPFKKEFELHEGQNVTIEIHFPEFLLNNFEKIPLFIDHSTIHSTSNYLSVQINNSIWATYNLSDSKFLNIKIKHLQFGLNKLRFFLKKDISERDNFVDATIKELRFDFANVASLKEQLSEENNLKGKPEVSVKDKRKENSDINKPKELRKKHDGLQKSKDLNRAFDKRTRKYLQHALKSLGYYHGRVDGVFGHKTCQAIKAYQKNKGETPTGYFDKKTATEFIQIGKRASRKAKKEFAAKAKIDGNLTAEQKKSTDYQEQNKTDTLLLSIKNKIAENQKEKAREIERSLKLNKVSKKQEIKEAEVSINRNDGIVRTPEELGKRYQSLIDGFNLSMNKTFYNQMIASIESCDRTGYYVSGAFISHYLYMRFKDLASNAQTSSDVHRNTKLAERFKNTRNRLILHYNISTENKQALKDVLHKCETYYQKTKPRFLHSKN
jgi:hypothetical protein